MVGTCYLDEYIRGGHGPDSWALHRSSHHQIMAIKRDSCACGGPGTQALARVGRHYDPAVGAANEEDDNELPDEDDVTEASEEDAFPASIGAVRRSECSAANGGLVSKKFRKCGR